MPALEVQAGAAAPSVVRRYPLAAGRCLSATIPALQRATAKTALVKMVGERRDVAGLPPTPASSAHQSLDTRLRHAREQLAHPSFTLCVTAAAEEHFRSGDPASRARMETSLNETLDWRRSKWLPYLNNFFKRRPRGLDPGAEQREGDHRPHPIADHAMEGPALCGWRIGPGSGPIW